MATTTVAVRYFAAARAAAGVEAEKIDVPADATVEGLLAAVRAQHGDELSAVLDRCSFLLDEVAVRDRGTLLAGAATRETALLWDLPPHPVPRPPQRQEDCGQNMTESGTTPKPFWLDGWLVELQRNQPASLFLFWVPDSVYARKERQY